MRWFRIQPQAREGSRNCCSTRIAAPIAFIIEWIGIVSVAECINHLIICCRSTIKRGGSLAINQFAINGNDDVAGTVVFERYVKRKLIPAFSDVPFGVVVVVVHLLPKLINAYEVVVVAE